jgi:hypothetical protein
MHSNSNDQLVGVLESTRELLRYVESRESDLQEYALETRLRVDREIENLRRNS